MKWQNIIKTEERANALIDLVEDNMSVFNDDDKEFVGMIIKMLKENYTQQMFESLRFLAGSYDLISAKSRVLKGTDDWRKNLKRFKGKPKPKQTDVIIQYLKTNPKQTIAQIQRNLEITHPQGMSSKRLRKFLEDNPSIVVSGRYPTSYSYREGISKARKRIPIKRIRDAIDNFVNSQDDKITVRQVQQAIIKKFGVMGMTQKPGSVKNYLFGWHTEKSEEFDPNIHRKEDFYYELGDE